MPRVLTRMRVGQILCGERLLQRLVSPGGSEKKGAVALCFNVTAPFFRQNNGYSVKSPFPRQACLPVGKGLYDTPIHEHEVGKGPHGMRMYRRIVGARSAEQSVTMF